MPRAERPTHCFELPIGKGRIFSMMKMEAEEGLLSFTNMLNVFADG